MAPQDIDAVNTAVNAARTAGASPADMWKVVKSAGWSPDAYVKAVAAQKAIRNVAAPAPADAAAGAGATGDAAAAAAAPAPGVDPSGNSPTGALQAFGHGASMGASDNVGGLVDAIVNRAQDPGSAVDMPTIRARIADRKASRAGFESAHPIAGGALELAGGIMTGGGVNKALASGVERVAGSKAAALLTMKAGQYGRNILRGGAQGTAYGAAVGANDAAPGDTMDGAEMGGLVGAAGGMAFGALAPAGVAAAQKIGGGVQSLYNYASGMLNPAVAARNFASRAPVGINPLLDAMGRAGKTPADLRASLQDANAMGAQDSIATASQPGGSVQQLAKRSVIQPGPGKDIGRAAIADSTAAIRPQIESNIESATGLPVQDSSAEVAQRMAQRKGTSSANYGALPTDPINDPALIQRLDSNPAYRRAHEAYMTAHNSSAERGTEVTPMWSTVVDSQGKSSVELTRAPTQQDLDGISRVVKGQADNAKASARSGTDTSGTSGVETANLGKANSSLLDLVHGTENSASVAPELSAAKTSHRTSSEVIDAMMAGRDTHMAGSNARPYACAGPSTGAKAAAGDCA